MPLLGRKIHHLVKPLTMIDPKASVYVIKHTGECFQSKDDYTKRLNLYNENIWTCQSTGHINLTHQEAWKSEQDAKQQLKKIFPEYLEKPVLQIVHNSTQPLDSLIDQAYIKINTMFFPGDHVQFKVKNGGRVIKGRILTIEKDDESRMSPCSDKENSDNTDVNHNDATTRKYPLKLLPYKYNLRLLDEDKIVSAVPAEDLTRCDRPPGKDTLKLFIRTHALRNTTNPTSPWVVDQKLVKKYLLLNKLTETPSKATPSKVTPSKGLESKSPEKKRKASVDSEILRYKKLKVDSTSMKSQPSSRNHSKNSSNGVKYLDSNDTDDDCVIISPEKKPIRSPEKTSSKNSPEIDHSYSSPKKKRKVSIADSNKINSKNQPVVKLHQLKMPNDKIKSPVKKQSKSVKVNGKDTANGASVNGQKRKRKKSENGGDKMTKENNLNGKKQKMKQVTLMDLQLIKKNKMKSPDKSKTTKSPLKKTPLKKSPEKVKKTPKKSEVVGKMEAKKPEEKKETLLPIGEKPKRKKIIKPLLPSQTLMYIQRLTEKVKAPKSSNVAHMLDRLIITLTKEQVEKLPEVVRNRLQRRIEFKANRAKFAGMTKEDREKFLKKVKAKSSEPREDKTLDLRPLPEAELVPTPDGVPNELFGDLVMVVEFINCYSGLLMPDEPYPVQTDLLMKAVASGSEGFGYLSRILLILLQTLLQDRIADDYKELGVRLSDLPINIHTASELVRLCLRSNDDADTDANGAEQTEEFEDVSDNILSLLETSELYELIPQHKLRILIGICHRIMNSYSVQEYMEQKQKYSVQLWKDLTEQKKLIISNKDNWAKDEKPKEDEGKEKEENVTVNNIPDPFSREKKNEIQKNEASENNAQNEKIIENESQKLKTSENMPEKEKTNENDVQKENTSETKEQEENSINKTPAFTENEGSLLSAVKRRRQYALEEKKKQEEKRKEEKEKILKEQEKKLILSRKDELEKNYDAVKLAAGVALRQTALGYDRNHTRYWLFSHGTMGLYLEKGWVSEDIEYSVGQSTVEESEVIELSDSDDEPLSNLKKRESDKDLTFPVVGQNLWFHYKTLNEVDELIASLCENGIREGRLLAKLKSKRQDISRSFNLKRTSKMILKSSNGDTELLEAFKKELTETEVRLRKGLLGGVPNLSQWEERLKTATGIEQLIPCLLETQANVLPRFFQGIMKVKYNNDEEEDCDKLQKWIENVEQCTTMSRLHVLLGVLDACILWEKSTENAKCKICRRKNEDLVLILCDNCNLAFHLLCLRPSLSHVPQGEWICPACQPTSVRQKDRVEKQQSRNTDQDQITVCTTTDREPPTTERRLRSTSNNITNTTTAVQTRTRSSRREKVEKVQWKDESETEEEEVDEEDEEISGSDNSNEGSECCLCGGDEDVVQCGKCNLGYHTFCHVPPMHNKPRGNWVCNSCQTGKKPKSLKTARKKWQKWKLSVSPDDETAKAKPKNNSNSKGDMSVQQITTRLRQRINESIEDNPSGSKISSREARALRRALGREEEEEEDED